MSTKPFNDFIFVLTVTGDVQPLTLDHILKVNNTPGMEGFAVVHLLTGTGAPDQLVIHECAEMFLYRHERLLKALRQHDLSEINLHLLPVI